jgi:hypothetical protein
VNGIPVAQGKVQWAGFCEHCNEPLSFIKAGNSLISQVTINFSRRSCPMKLVLQNITMV